MKRIEICVCTSHHYVDMVCVRGRNETGDRMHQAAVVPVVPSVFVSAAGAAAVVVVALSDEEPAASCQAGMLPPRCDENRERSILPFAVELVEADPAAEVLAAPLGTFVDDCGVVT